MGKFKPVTEGHKKRARKIAIEKLVCSARFQQAFNDGSLDGWLNSLKIDPNAIIPPQDARIKIVRVKFRQDRPWQQAVTAAGPNTGNNESVRVVGDQYPSTGTEEVEENFILLNYPKGNGNWDRALGWGEGAGLKNTMPREVFAIGEHHPKLHEQFGLNPMCVVATTARTFNTVTFIGRGVCSVWWRNSDRNVSLLGAAGLLQDCAWLVFRM